MYIFVHGQLYRKLHNYYFTIINILFECSGNVPGTDLGPVISPQSKQRILSLVQSGVDEGATLLLDGRNHVVKGFEKGNFVGPTILTNVKVGWSVVYIIMKYKCVLEASPRCFFYTYWSGS